MALVLPVKGSLNWDISLNAALTYLDNNNSSSISSSLQKANNLSDLSNIATARANLDLSAGSLIGGLFYNVKDYGVVADGITDNTATIQAVLNNAAASSATAPSSTVYFPPGFYVTGPITIGHRTTVRGAGPGATTLIAKAAIAANSYLISNSGTARMTSVFDMRIQGNASAQTGTVHGLNFNGTGSGIEYTDMRAQARNLVVENFTGDGITLANRGVCQLNSIQSWANQGNGFNLGIDSEVSDCDAGQSGLDGFLITGNVQLSNCKSWFSGWISTSPNTAAFTAGAVQGNGFHFLGSGSGTTCSGLYAQDNARAGIYLSGTCDRVNITGWTSDSNNNNASSTTYSNVEVNNSFDSILIGGVSFDRNANAQRPKYGATIGGGAGDIILEYVGQGFATGSAGFLDPASVTYNNTIRVNQSDGSVFQAYASSFTPDNTQGGMIRVGNLTGNITIAAPVVTTASFLTLVFQQDATGGRTITWNAAYNTSWQPNLLANAKSSITFQWNSNDTLWEPLANKVGRGGIPLSAILTSAQTTTSTGTSVITGLSIADVPAGTYIMEMYIIWEVSVAGDPSFGVTGGSLTTLSYLRNWQVTTSTFLTDTIKTAYGVNAITGTISATTNLQYEAEGVLVTSAAGTFSAEWASPVGTTTVTAQPGSYIRLTPVAP